MKKKSDEGLEGGSDSGEVLRPHGLTFTCFMSINICIHLISTVRLH